MEKREEILRVLALSLRGMMGQAIPDYTRLQEIRIRAGAPLAVIYENIEYFVSENGKLGRSCEDAYIIRKNELKETVEYICNYSVYAYEEEMRQGFITIQGGHRIGLCGKVVCERERVKSLKNIAFLNIRLSHQILGCADGVLPYVRGRDGIFHTLIISPPRCGKTTLLRDLIRNISNGSEENEGLTVGVVDERSELGACYLGIPQNDLGIRTDILDCCPKAQGMLMLVRAMSPRVLAVDEIGGSEDVAAIAYVAGCGCKLLATLHGSDLEDIRRKPYMNELFLQRLWERYIVLDNTGGIGNIRAIYDGDGRLLTGKRGSVC